VELLSVFFVIYLMLHLKFFSFVGDSQRVRGENSEQIRYTSLLSEQYVKGHRSRMGDMNKPCHLNARPEGSISGS